jgi:long-chain-fatty-acid--CoA ligase ACSBG
VKTFAVGAAPIARSTLEYFFSLNWVIFNFYGMSESAAPTTANTFGSANLFSAGCAMPGTELVILSENGTPVPQGKTGEICFRGRNKFMGYYKQPEETMATIDANGFIHSGDEGYLDERGFLFITGRFKELIITAGGENVPPVLIEHAIKDTCRLISNIFIVGDNRKYLTALVTLKSVMDGNNEPTDQLGEESKRILEEIGSNATTVAQARDCSKVI